jgi:hypothetical protein
MMLYPSNFESQLTGTQMAKWRTRRFAYFALNALPSLIVEL